MTTQSPTQRRRADLRKPPGRWIDRLHAVRLRLRSGLVGSDLAARAAGVSWYAAVATVPCLLVGLRMSAAVFGKHPTSDRVTRIISALPAKHQIQGALTALAAAGIDLPWLSVAMATIPASFLGEGLRRGFSRSAAQPPGRRFSAWRGRLAALPLILLIGPGVISAFLAAGSRITPLLQSGGAHRVLGIVLGYYLLLGLAWPTVATGFALLDPTSTTPKALVYGSGLTAAVLAGFAEGFVLFLLIPLPWSIPFGDLTIVGIVTALLLWLFVFCLLTLLGHQFMIALQPGPTRH